MSGPERLGIAVDRILPAAPETVFRALTEPELYARWMGPDGSTTTVEELEAVPGGRLAFVVALPGGQRVRLEGEYLEVDPPRRLVHTWRADGDESATTVTIRLHRVGSETHLLLTHDGFTDDADRAQNQGGWEHQLARLARLLEEGVPG